VYIVLFFFSSRRRHTRSKRDWSSDVCSSDLELRMAPVGLRVIDPDYINIMITGHQNTIFVDLQERLTSKEAVAKAQAAGAKGFKIGRASCRERGEVGEVGVAWQGEVEQMYDG